MGAADVVGEIIYVEVVGQRQDKNGKGSTSPRLDDSILQTKQSGWLTEADTLCPGHMRHRQQRYVKSRQSTQLA